VKQIIQNYKTGKIRLEQVPPPICRPGGVLVRNVASAVSLGTERSIIDLGKKSLIGKARARPDLFKKALNKAKRKGFWKTFQEAMGRLDTPNPSLGTVEYYCNKAFRSFYYSPKYVWWRIKKIRDSEEFIRVAKSGFYAVRSLPTLGRVILKKVR